MAKMKAKPRSLVERAKLIPADDRRKFLKLSAKDQEDIRDLHRAIQSGEVVANLKDLAALLKETYGIGYTLAREWVRGNF